MELKDSIQFVEKCFHEEPAACQCSCPFDFDIKSFLTKAAKGRWPAAYRDFSTALVFPVVAIKYCGKRCLSPCQKALSGKDAVNIPDIERSCLSFTSSEKSPFFSIPPKAEKIAIVGAGIAGLSCALCLARKKYQITVFEKTDDIGGSLKNDPDFELIKADIIRQFGNEKITFYFNTNADEKILEGYDAIYIATGKSGEDFGLKEYWNSDNFSCSKNGWFLGGSLCNMDIPQSINAGRLLSQYIEAYIQTGRKDFDACAGKKTVNCEQHMIIHEENEVKDPVIAQGDIYTKEEAKAEASRCMQCICSHCLNGCEVLKKYKKAPFKLAAEICGDANATPPFSNCEATREVYSCNLCSYCENVCPEGINIGELFKFSREDRWKQGKWIPAIHDFWLRTLDFNLCEGFYASPEPHKFVFFPGCQLDAILPEQTLKSYLYLKSKLDIGILLSCCGAPAVWAGDLDRKEKTKEQLKIAFEQMENPVVITACSSCTSFLSELFPEIEIVSLYEIINEEGFNPTVPPFEDAAVFSPCSALHNATLQKSINSILDKCGCKAEILNNRGKCCGYGGHIKLANKPLYDEISTNRIADSAKPYVVYCANCLDVFRSKHKQSAHILEFVFGAGPETMPTLEEKRQNILSLKERIMEDTSELYEKKQNEWDKLNITFSKEARANMEDKLILDSEIAEVIFKAERDKQFFETANGTKIASLEKDVLTFWAEYKKTDNGFFVEYAYYHRMHIIVGYQNE